MKNVKSVNYWQIDHIIKQISEKKGVVILPSPEAWGKFGWVKKYFLDKPKEGCFIWVKKQIDFPLFVRVSIGTKKIQQELQNLLIVEKNLKISLQGACNSLKKNLCGIHKAQGKIILKEDSALKYNHSHSWDQKDIVESNYEFILEKNAKLDYTYKNLFTPKKLKINTLLNLFEGASCDVKITVNGVQTKAEIQDTLVLREKGASGIIKLRLVGGKKSDISAHSQILAVAQSRGHLDCQGLLVDEDSKISLTPRLICQNKNAQITHEASIGKISEDELNYLRMRGLTQNEAIKLILTGFLEIK
ncbi:MAG: SufD family Fe-S cluster assembly protein [bacterium]|nr:SufD family Fe-S cluster assembly protein [bacterium]